MLGLSFPPNHYVCVDDEQIRKEEGSFKKMAAARIETLDLSIARPLLEPICQLSITCKVILEPFFFFYRKLKLSTRKDFRGSAPSTADSSTTRSGPSVSFSAYYVDQLIVSVEALAIDPCVIPSH